VFGFDGKEIIGKSVNNIMPITFASYHDSLLMNFLKNRNQKVNGDERVLVGKNKNGLIFPVMLRLQRVIASNDELIFVANIRRFKKRESPIMLIVTPDG
jgi:PAS domain S-box-containing protein